MSLSRQRRGIKRKKYQPNNGNMEEYQKTYVSNKRERNSIIRYQNTRTIQPYSKMVFNGFLWYTQAEEWNTIYGSMNT